MLLQLLWINNYYLETQYNEQELPVVAKFTKADLQYFVLTFIKHLLSRKSDKPLNFNINN